jgi:hypothetical protein
MYAHVPRRPHATHVASRLRAWVSTTKRTEIVADIQRSLREHTSSQLVKIRRIVGPSPLVQYRRSFADRDRALLYMKDTARRPYGSPDPRLASASLQIVSGAGHDVPWVKATEAIAHIRAYLDARKGDNR